MSIILNAMGAPEPSPEIRRRLQAIHPKLDLKFVEAAGHHWAISLSWEDNDRRRELIQNGGIDPSGDYDIIGYLPLDCTADEAPAYIARVFREFPREDVQNLIGRINHYNETPAQKASEGALAEVLDAKDPSKASGPKIQVDVVSDVPKKPAPKKRAPRKKSTAAKSKYL